VLRAAVVRVVLVDAAGRRTVARVVVVRVREVGMAYSSLVCFVEH